MKTFLLSLLMGALLLVAGSAFAFNVPTPTGYVTDTTGKLSASQVSQLNQRLTDYQRRTKNEIAVLLVPTLGGDNLEDVTQQVFQTYKVGKAGLDNGVLLLIVLNDHKMRLQTGKGIEGEITDIQSNDILSSMKTPFRAGNFYAGISTALDQIQGKLDARNGQKVDPGVGQQFNKPVPSTDSTATPAATTKNGSCSVGVVGNVAGFGFGFLALLVLGIALARRWVRNNEVRKMAELEAKIDAEIANEKAQALEEKNRLARQEQHAAMLKAEREAEAASLKASREAAARLAATTKAVISTPPPPARKFAAGALIPPPNPTHKATVIASHVDEPPVRLPSHDAAAAATVAATAIAIEEAERLRRERLAREAKQRLENELEEQRLEARRERLAEERRAEERRAEARRREEEAAAAVTVVSYSSYSSDDSSSSSSDSGSSWGGSDSGGSDSGFGGGDSGGGGSSSDW